MRSFLRQVVGLIIVISAAGLASGCGALMRSIARPTINHLVTATMKQDDLELVRQGAPSYLLMIDGLVESNPNDVSLLVDAAKLYSAYESAFVAGKDPERAKRLSKRAFNYAIRAMSLRNKIFARLYDKPFSQFEHVVNTIDPYDKDLLFVVVSTWAGYIEANRDDWDVLAQLPKVKLLAERLLELDESYYYGFPHLMIAVLNSLLPPGLGGKPQEARRHFEQAIELGKGKFLQAYVLYATYYARAAGDRALYDKLLQHVMRTPADVIPELTLVNTVAKAQAKELMAKESEIF